MCHAAERSGPTVERDYQEAIELNPGYATAHQWYAYSLSSEARHDEARERILKARELDPLSRVINAFVPFMAYLARDYDRAIEESRRALELGHNSASAHVMRGLAFEQKGMYDEAIAALGRSTELHPGVAEDLAALGHAFGRAKKRLEAERILEQLQRLSAERYVSPFDVAIVYCGLGETDQAFAWLDKAYVGRAYWIVLLGVDPRLDPLRDDPRFSKLLPRTDLSR